jgi:hypothetical protein
MNTSSLTDFTTARAAERPILLSGGAVVTMDPDVPDLDAGDVLLIGSRIAAIGADLRSHPEHGADAAAALVVDTVLAAPSSAPASSTATGTPGRRSCGAASPTSRTSAST